jgi:hypothetical protein
VTKIFSCIQTVVMEYLDNSFYVHHHHGGVLGGKCAVDQDFECCDVGRGSGDVAGIIESFAAYGQPDSFLLRLVWFVIANYFAVSDLPVFRDVCEFDKETCIGSRNISNSLKKLPAFFSKTSFPKRL